MLMLLTCWIFKWDSNKIAQTVTAVDLLKSNKNNTTKRQSTTNEEISLDLKFVKKSPYLGKYNS